MIVVTLGAIALQSLASLLLLSAVVGLAALLLGVLSLLMSRAFASATRDLPAGCRLLLQPATVRVLCRERRPYSSSDGHPAGMSSRAPPSFPRPPRSIGSAHV